MSVEYYARLERGNAKGASDSVLEALASALQLDDAERAHLRYLIRTLSSTRSRRRPSSPRERSSVQQLLDAMAHATVGRNAQRGLGIYTGLTTWQRRELLTRA